MGMSDPEGSEHGTQCVCLVVETRGGTNGQAVTRPGERAKIDCVKVYFGETSKECQDFEYEVQSEF